MMCILSLGKQGPEMELDSLLCKISALVSLLSSLEKRVSLHSEQKSLLAACKQFAKFP